MKEISFLVNEEILSRAEDVLDNIGLDLDSAVRMFLKKIGNEQSLAFLFSEVKVAKPEEKRTPTAEIHTQRELTKTITKKVLIQNGYTLAEEVRYSKRNKATSNYWQNFDIDLFNEPLSIILNDQFNRKLYLFNIPAGAVDTGALQRRADKEDVVDLQIRGDDASFTDTKSGVSFKEFLVAEVGY